MARDAYLDAFLDPEGPRVFSSIQFRNDIFRPDPHDVPSMHEETRKQFNGMLERQQKAGMAGSGRILLLKGNAGCGKTHLMRAFRNGVHGSEKGYFGYLQLSDPSQNYMRYVLRGLINSLDEPYNRDKDQTTGLLHLSKSLVEEVRILHKAFPDNPRVRAIDAIQERLAPEASQRLITQIVPKVLEQPGFAEHELDVDLLRALLYLQTGDPMLRNLVSKYLRCERLTEADEARLGGIASRAEPEDPSRMLCQLGRLMWIAGGKSLVISIDQVEDVYNQPDAEDIFRRAMMTVRKIADEIPTAILVVACLDNYYAKLRPHLSQSVLDRLEHDPKPSELRELRGLDMVRALVGRRLQALYAHADLDAPEDPCYPFAEEELSRLRGLSPREVLRHCEQWQVACQDAGALTPPPWDAPGPVDPSPPPAEEVGGTEDMEQAWQRHLAAWESKLLGDEEELAALLGETLPHAGEEVDSAPECEVQSNRVKRVLPGADVLCVAVCNRPSQGGGLMRQVHDARQRAQGRELLLLRSSAWPDNPNTKTVKLLREMADKEGAQYREVSSTTWRTLEAMGPFREKWRNSAHFAAWQRKDHPLYRLDLMRTLLPKRDPGNGVNNGNGKTGPKPDEKPALEKASKMPAAVEGGKGGRETPEPRMLELGVKLGIGNDPVRIGTEALKKHTAILGGSGSGKTTLAMRLIEEAVLHGRPVIIMDRKGDLANYADPEAAPLCGEAGERLRRIQRDTAVRVYTPGDADGVAPSLEIMPVLGPEASKQEVDTVAGHAAQSLATMMSYGKSPTHQSKLSVLKTALALFSRNPPPGGLSLEVMIEAVTQPDSRLAEEVKLPYKCFEALGHDLESLRLSKGMLLEGSGVPLDLDEIMNGPGLHIFCLRAMPNASEQIFWVAQFTIQLARWLVGNPSEQLQGLFFLDEADIYLPATSKPASKEPLDDLLRRARSAGLGVVLASQSPADFDYKCRENVSNWLLGRVQEKRALDKLSVVLSGCKGNVGQRLAGQNPGQFVLVQEQEAVRMQAHQGCIGTRQRSSGEIRGLSLACADGASPDISPERDQKRPSRC